MSNARSAAAAAADLPPAAASDPRPVNVDAATARALKLWVVLARAHRAIGAHAAAHAARRGLTLAEFGALEALYHRGDMLLSDLQRRILVSSGGITFLVDRLTKKGLVTRRRCTDDRRARFASLTPAGERLVREIFPEHAARIREVCAGLSAEEQRTAAALLRTLGVAAAAEPPLPQAGAPSRGAPSARPRASRARATRPRRPPPVGVAPLAARRSPRRARARAG
jgi:MarR family 2-MHQ and catechol resistance regulon transcriptional repressor